MGAPSRILFSMQAGVVLLAAGRDDYVSGRIDPDRADPCSPSV
jgi:hypothetical protein